MVSTSVLLVAVLSSYALIAGAFYALVAVLAQRIDRLDTRVEGRFDRLESEVAGLKAAVAVLESRRDY
jgi:outer membrane murein-binding lipoprotein Lpp